MKLTLAIMYFNLQAARVRPILEVERSTTPEIAWYAMTVDSMLSCTPSIGPYTWTNLPRKDSRIRAFIESIRSTVLY